MNYEQAQNEIVKIFKSLSPKWGMHNVWRDFITLAACAISNSVDKQQYDKREEMYMRTVEKYDTKEANWFAEALALVASGLERRLGDFMGELYMMLELGNSESGQFFTPYDVSKMMARFIAEPIERSIERDGYVTLNEPAVGAGAMIIAYADIMQQEEYNYQSQLRVICNDIDYDVVKMCYIQLSLAGIDAVVMQGNTLTLEYNEVWYTPIHIVNAYEDHQRNQQKEKVSRMTKILRDLQALEQRQPLDDPVQLNLFDEVI